MQGTLGAGISATATQSLALTAVRGALAEALAPRDDSDPDVVADIPDAVSPPLLLLEWANPWLTPRTVGMQSSGGWWDAHVNVLCLSGRLEPGPGIAELERLLSYAVVRLDGDGRSWPVESSTAPRDLLFAGVHYLGARLNLRLPVVIESEAAQ